MNHPLGPEKELDHRLLEEDLSLQLSLLESELSKHSKNEMMTFDESKGNPLSNVKAVAEEVEREFIIEPGLPEVAAVCGALLFIYLAPQIVGM